MKILYAVLLAGIIGCSSVKETTHTTSETTEVKLSVPQYGDTAIASEQSVTFKSLPAPVQSTLTQKGFTPVDSVVVTHAEVSTPSGSIKATVYRQKNNTHPAAVLNAVPTPEQTGTKTTTKTDSKKASEFTSAGDQVNSTLTRIIWIIVAGALLFGAIALVITKFQNILPESVKSLIKNV